MSALSVSEQAIRLFAGIGVTLLVASVIGYVLKAGVAHGRPHGVIDNLNARIRSWWVIVSVVAVAFMLGRDGMTLLFAFASFMALREFAAPIPSWRDDGLLAVSFLVVLPVQYVLVRLGWFGWYSTFVPVCAFVLMPIVVAATRTCFITRRVMRCGQNGPDARRPTKAICRYGQGGQRCSRPSWPQPRRGRGAEQRLPPLRAYLAGLRPAVGKRPLRGASLCREPLQYRHIAAGSPPRPAPQLASVAHVPGYETGSNARRYAERATTIQWGLVICVYCISHVPAILTLDIAGYEGRNPLLIVFLVVVVQSSDVLQYVWGKLCGRRKVAPAISSAKTWEGLIGGVASATTLGAALFWITPFTPTEAALMALAANMMGVLGGFVMSAIKRSRGIKDWGSLIEGHGGMLDRLDSMVLAAPVFFHLTRVGWA